MNEELCKEYYISRPVSHPDFSRGTSATAMAGRNRENRASGRGDFHGHQEQDQASNNHNHNRPMRGFGSVNQDRGRKRSNAHHTPSQSSGIPRSTDNSNPALNARFKTLKRHSDLVKRELEDLISVIDAMQPDSAAMDWSGSAGTIVYVPVHCAADGSFQHPDMRSTNPSNWPYNSAASKPTFQNPGAPYDSAAARPNPTIALRPTIRQEEHAGPIRDDEGSVHTTTAPHASCDNADTQVQRGPSTVEEEGVKRQRQAQQPQTERGSDSEIVQHPPSGMQHRGVISNLDSQRTNYQPPTVTTLPSPPASPLGGGRRESCTM
jgi:hypothetical protein